MQFFSHDNKDYRSILDPRTKLLLLIAINVVMMGTGFQGTDFALRMICAVIPFVLLLLIGKRRAALWYVIAGSVMLVCEGYVIPHTTGIINLHQYGNVFQDTDRLCLCLLRDVLDHGQ